MLMYCISNSYLLNVSSWSGRFSFFDVNDSKVPKARISSYEAILKGNVVDGGVEDTVPLWEHRPHPTQRRDLSSSLSRLRHPKSLSTPTRSSRLVIPRKFVVAHLPREEPALTTSTLGCSSMLLVVELLTPWRPRRDIVKMDSRQEIPSFVHCCILSKQIPFCVFFTLSLLFTVPSLQDPTSLLDYILKGYLTTSHCSQL
jgi:hypothetical protein